MYTGSLVKVVNTPYLNYCSITGIILLQGAIQCCLDLVEGIVEIDNGQFLNFELQLRYKCHSEKKFYKFEMI